MGKFSLLQVTRYNEFPFGRTVLRFENPSEKYVSVQGNAEVFSPPHEKLLRLVVSGAAHLTIYYLFACKLEPDILPRPEHNIIGLGFRGFGADSPRTFRAEPATTLSVAFEPSHVVVSNCDGCILTELGRFELTGLSVLILETLVPPSNLLPALVPTQIITPQPKVIQANAAAPQSVSRRDARAWAGLRDWQNALLEILAGLCGPDDRRTTRNRRGYYPRRSRG